MRECVKSDIVVMTEDIIEIQYTYYVGTQSCVKEQNSVLCM